MPPVINKLTNAPPVIEIQIGDSNSQVQTSTVSTLDSLDWVISFIFSSFQKKLNNFTLFDLQPSFLPNDYKFK